MIDIDEVYYTIKEIERHRDIPYPMANEELAVEMLPELKKAFPELQMVKFGIFQWLTVNKKSREKLKIQLKEMISKRKKEITDLEKSINELE